MSKYFGFVDGEPHDFVFKPHGNWDHWKKFYLGEHFICFVIKDTHKAGWSVIVSDIAERAETPGKVEGFVSRHAAIDYALMVHPKTRDTYHNDRHQAIWFADYLAKRDKKPVSQKLSFYAHILKHAPEGATHYVVHEYNFIEAYVRLDDGVLWIPDEDGVWIESPSSSFVGLREIQALEDVRNLANLEVLRGGYFNDSR